MVRQEAFLRVSEPWHSISKSNHLVFVVNTFLPFIFVVATNEFAVISLECSQCFKCIFTLFVHSAAKLQAKKDIRVLHMCTDVHGKFTDAI